MIKISPSILSSDFSRLGEVVSELDHSSADYIHVDVMDGHFVPNITIGPSIVKSIRKYTQKPFDVHLMLSDPGKYIEQFADAGSDIIGIHHEIKSDKIELLKKIKSLGKKSCIVYNPDTSLENIEDYFPYVDQILLMSVFPGFGGQKFIRACLERGKYVRDKLISKQFSKIDLEIDGGVDTKNAPEIIEHGFNVLVSGNTIFKSQNMEETIQELRKLK